MNVWSWVGILTSAFATCWVFCRYLLVITVRLDARTFKTLYEISKQPDNWHFVLSEEIITEAKYPLEYRAICAFAESPWFFINHSERLLSGFISKDAVCTVTCFRWSYDRLKVYLAHQVNDCQLNKLGIRVELILPFYTDMVGLIKAEAPKPALNPSLWEDIEADAAGVFDGSKKKSGALLYGPPGNNKTFFVKYLACKYKVPIKIITFSPDHSNFDVMLMFSQITTRCIVLMEDFDNYFHGRKCILGSDNKNIKFTFDMILNGLDGVYNTYEQVFFIMTVNDIEKVDWALKNRPSRFKFLRQFTCPELDTRKKLLPLEWAEQSEGMNLDQVFRLKEFHDEGLTLEQAKNNLGTANKLQALQELAHALYEKRVANGTAGSCTGDWLEAEKQLGLK